MSLTKKVTTPHHSGELIAKRLRHGQRCVNSFAGLDCGLPRSAAPPPCLAERLRLSEDASRVCYPVEAVPQPARRSLA